MGRAVFYVYLKEQCQDDFAPVKPMASLVASYQTKLVHQCFSQSPVLHQAAWHHRDVADQLRLIYGYLPISLQTMLLVEDGSTRSGLPFQTETQHGRTH